MSEQSQTIYIKHRSKFTGVISDPPLKYIKSKTASKPLVAPNKSKLFDSFHKLETKIAEIPEKNNSNLIANDRETTQPESHQQSSRESLNSSFLFAKRLSSSFIDTSQANSSEKNESSVAILVVDVADEQTLTSSTDFSVEEKCSENVDALKAEKNREKRDTDKKVETHTINYKTSRIIKELLDTERSYIESLKRGIENFIVQYDSDTDLPATLVGKRRHIFSNIERICSFHETFFLPKMVECGTDLERIAKTFTDAIDAFDFDIYIVFMISRRKSELICVEHEDFFKRKIFFQNCPLGIKNFLLQPVQRLPRYKMMLEEIVKNLMLSFEDHKAEIAAFCVAEKQIQRFLNFINENC